MRTKVSNRKYVRSSAHNNTNETKVLIPKKCYDISTIKNQKFRTVKHLHNETHIERNSEVHPVAITSRDKRKYKYPKPQVIYYPACKATHRGILNHENQFMQLQYLVVYSVSLINNHNTYIALYCTTVIH